MKRIFLMSLLVVVACGKQGPPRPPVPLIAKATTDLKVAQRGPIIILSWEYPALTTAGESLTSVDRIVVYRYNETVPEALSARFLRGEIESSSDEPGEIALFGAMPVIPAAQFAKLGRKIGELARDEIPSYTTGARVVVQDRPPLRTEDGLPIRYTYGVTTITGGRESEVSNLMTIVPIDVPAAPRDLVVEAVAEGAVLSWSAPERTVLGSSDPEPAGYRVYRFRSEGAAFATAEPTVTVGSGELSAVDPAPPGEWRYAVTALGWEGDSVQESDLSLVLVAELRDLAPPPAPANVTPLVEPTVVRVLWAAVEAPDLAGYRIYRQSAGGDSILLGDVVAGVREYVDESASPGVEYVYSVTAVDTSGNESSATPSETVLVRR